MMHAYLNRSVPVLNQVVPADSRDCYSDCPALILIKNQSGIRLAWIVENPEHAAGVWITGRVYLGELRQANEGWRICYDGQWWTVGTEARFVEVLTFGLASSLN